MKKYYYILFIGLLSLLTGCEEEFDMDFPDYAADGIVFKGLITNEKPPYFFHLSRPASMSAGDNVYEGIEDATLVVTDITADIKDTMQLTKPYSVDYYYGGMLYNYYDYYNKKNTSAVINIQYKNCCNGMYVTTKIYGIEGHSYRLDIYRGENHYQSDIQKMEPALVITDMKLKKFDLGTGKASSWAPCISFINPPGVDNYYMFRTYYASYTHFTFISPQEVLNCDENWKYSMLSDEYLENNVVDFLIDDGENALGYPNGRDYPKGDSVYVWAHTISKSCYDIFEQMKTQFRSDGGAYTPVPTGVKGNISGGVYGCFRVSAVSEKGVHTGNEH